jgi:hypothetical protein
VVAQREAAQRQRLVDHAETKRGRRVAGTLVMVAAYQRQRQLRVLVPPLRQRGERGSGVRTNRMKEIAEKDHMPRAGGPCQRRHAGERRGGGALRHRHAEFSKRHRLADMRIGDQQAMLAGQVGGLVGQQRERPSGQLDLDHLALSGSTGAVMPRGARSASA